MKIVLSFMCILLLSELAIAKDLTHRLGMGIKSDLSETLPMLSAVYSPNGDYAFTGGLGVDTRKNQSQFAASAGIRRIVFRENQMNFHMGGQVAVVNYETSGVKNSGFELAALFGGEFFFSGLDSLAFTFEGGIGVVSTTEVRFRTIANDPFKAGMVFYF